MNLISDKIVLLMKCKKSFNIESSFPRYDLIKNGELYDAGKISIVMTLFMQTEDDAPFNMKP